ncbi:MULTISPECIES: SCO4225 family membrane protein [unclassified Streptomyces]|uniref:SCO4225 family membrane protein n=1 Tax=unclassified Streptomyces TaxID=2593676 RepID=UPI0036E4C0C6
MSNGSPPPRFSRLWRLLSLATDNWLARGYLGVFAASVPVALLAPDSAYAMAPVLLTEPLSMAGIVVPFGDAPAADAGGAAVLASSVLGGGWLLACALVNAAVIGALAHHVRDVRSARHA